MSKLLVFNDDYGDEHNVPALAVMSDEEYEIWLKSPSGKLNLKFEEESIVFQEKVDKYDKYREGLKERGLWTKAVKDYTQEDKDWMEANEVDYIYSGDYPKKCKSYMHAYLGNGGDCFDEGYSHYYLMEDFVENGTVIVTEVSEQFAEEFNKAGLGGLSMCNIFEMEERGYYDEDDE